MARRLLALPEVERAARVALYASLPDELPTVGIFAELRRRGLVVLFPRCLPDRSLGFAAVERWEDLVPGRYGVFEPTGPALALRDDDVVAVPGLAFDGGGRRLGRGGGCYDRTFPASAGPAPFLVGLGFGFQRVDEVPAGSADRRMDAVVTDLEAWRAKPDEPREATRK